MDPWYLPCISAQLPNDRTALNDTLEQEWVYPVKRTVILVCKAWNDIATEYLYEHIICKFAAKSVSSEALIAVLQDSAKGERLARMVIRVDIHNSFVHLHLQSTLLQLCPNLQSIYINNAPLYYPYPYSNGRRNLPTLSVVSDLLQTSEYQPFWSTADHWHSLTIYFDALELSVDPGIPIAPKNMLPPPPDSGGKEFINLRHINFISRGVSRYSIRNLKHWPLPSITHLTIKSYIPSAGGTYDEVLDILQSSPLGQQLKFFAFLVHFATPPSNTTAGGSLELLKAMPNLEEVALPFFWDSVQPPNTTITFPKVHTMGMDTNRFDYAAAETPEEAFATYAQTCCRLFPNMRTIRTTSTIPPHTVNYFLTTGVGPMIHLKRAAAVLRGRGIKFEDRAGWDIIKSLSW